MAKDEVKKTELNEAVLELSKKIEAAIKIDTKTGVGTVTGDPYHENLPEGLTKKIVEEVNKYDVTFVAASANAFGNIAVNAMAGNKKLEQASVELTAGHKNSLSVDVARSRTYANSLGDGTPVVKHGVIKAVYTVRAGENGGQLKKAKELIGDLAASKLV